MRGKVWEKLDNLNPRVGMAFGATIPLSGYSNVKPYVSLEVDVPDDLSVEEVYDMLEKALTEKFNEIRQLLEEQIGH